MFLVSVSEGTTRWNRVGPIAALHSNSKQQPMQADLHEQSIDWQILQDLLRCAGELGVDMRQVQLEAGHPVPSDPSDPIAFDSVHRFALLDRYLVDALRKAIYGQVGLASLSLQDYEILFHYMLGALNLRGALERITVFARLVESRLSNARLRLRTEGDLATLSLDWGAGVGQERFARIFFNEFLRLIYILEWMIGTTIEVRQILLPGGALSHHGEAICDCGYRVDFAGDYYVVCFGASALEAPIVRDLGDLQELMKVFPAVTLLRGGSMRLADRIARLLISQGLAGKPMLPAPQIASAMNVSEATMRRKLQEERTSYAEIRRQCQLRLARHLLLHSRASVAAIGYQIGFTDEAALRRAFKNWTAEAPAAWRARQRSGSEPPPRPEHQRTPEIPG